jgi:hypothetical protein
MMESVTYNQAWFVWGYTVVWFVVQDAAKVATYRVLRRAGWLPPARGGFYSGGGVRRYGSATLTPAELRRVEDAAVGLCTLNQADP